MSSTGNVKYKMRAYARYDSTGNIIPGSVQWRPQNLKMDPKIWKQLSPTDAAECCTCDCIITFLSTATVGNVTSIVSADGRISWSGTLTTGGYKSFVIPDCYDMEFTVTFGTVTSSGVDINGSTVQGDGVVSVSDSYIAAGAAGQTTTVSTTAVPCSEYTVTISDD